MVMGAFLFNSNYLIIFQGAVHGPISQVSFSDGYYDI